MREELPIGAWADLARRLDEHRTVVAWAQARPALAGLRSADDLLQRWRAGDGKHEVAAALVWLAAADGGDDADAVMVLLHFAEGVVWRLVRSLGDLCPDIAVLAVGELVAQIRGYRWRTRPGSLLTALYYDTRRALLADLQPREIPMGLMRDSSGDVADEPELDLLDLLTWAVRSRAIDALDARMVLEVAQESAPSRCTVVALRHGISTRRLLQRRTRALNALRSVAPKYLAEIA